MKNLSKDEQRLIQYLDKELNDSEMKMVEENLSARLHELKRADVLLRKSQTLDSPSKNFTTKVLQNLSNYNPSQWHVSTNGIFLLLGIIVAVGITLVFLSLGTYDMLEGTLSLQSFTANKNTIKLPTINFHGKLIINILLIATTAISFVVLDRTVLRPFFARRAA